MRGGGLIVIAGGVLALAAFLCLPYAAHGHGRLTGADIALALTYAGRHWRAAEEPALVAWWWLWWAVPALSVVAAGLGIAMAGSGAGTDKAHKRLYAAGAIEAALLAAILLLAFGLLLYAPEVLRTGGTCLPCDVQKALSGAQRLAGPGFWATLNALLVVVVGGAFALIWLATEREEPPPKRRIRRPVVVVPLPQEQPPKKGTSGTAPAAQRTLPGQTPLSPEVSKNAPQEQAPPEPRGGLRL